MCSNPDADFDGITIMENPEKTNLIGKLCRKCEKTSANVVLRKKDAYCKTCFLSSVNHKFRACLGKSKTMRPGDRVLIGFSGSENSVSLLHLIQVGLQDNSHKKLMFEPYIIFVDEASLLNLTMEEKSKINDSINQVLQKYNYPIHKVPLQLALKSEDAMDSYLAGDSNVEDDDSLVGLFSALKDITSRVDLLTKLRNTVLVQAARSLGCNKVFTAETANDLAVKLMTNVSLGRAAQLPYDVGFSDDRCPEVKVIRPLRDLSKKELIFYNVFHGLKSVHVPSLLTKIGPYSSIHKLTESFLSELQDGFPSTLSTVFRVADKLSTTLGDETMCPLCQSPLDTDSVAPSSLTATQFSRLLSRSGPSNFNSPSLEEINSGARCCSGDGSTNKTCSGSASCSSKLPDEELSAIFCYGCNLILRNANMEVFPDQIMKYFQESNQRFKMKKEIEEFLL